LSAKRHTLPKHDELKAQLDRSTYNVQPPIITTSKRIRLSKAIAHAAGPLSELQTPEDAKVAIRQVMKKFGIDPTTFEDTSGDSGLSD
jgi:hypothetical protein